MKVLEKSSIKKACPSCLAVLGIYKSDMHRDEIGHSGSEFTATCSECHTTIDIPSSEIPSGWMADFIREEVGH